MQRSPLYSVVLLSIAAALVHGQCTVDPPSSCAISGGGHPSAASWSSTLTMQAIPGFPGFDLFNFTMSVPPNAAAVLVHSLGFCFPPLVFAPPLVDQSTNLFPIISSDHNLLFTGAPDGAPPGSWTYVLPPVLIGLGLTACFQGITFESAPPGAPYAFIVHATDAYDLTF